MKQKGFAHIFLILFLLAGLAVAVYLVQQKTNILPKAYEPGSVTPGPGSGGYYIDKMPREWIIYFAVPVDPGGGFVVSALLKDMQGNVVTDQQDINYEWTTPPQGDGSLDVLTVTPFSGCTNGIQPPCPMDHATITTSSTASGLGGVVLVKAVKRSTNEVLATARYTLNLVPKNNYVYFTNVYPGHTQGETYSSGQTVSVSWNMEGNSISPVRYYRVLDQYYENGELTTGSIGTVQYPANSIDWVIPNELVGHHDITIELISTIEGEVMINGIGYSNFPFSVTGSGQGVGGGTVGNPVVIRPPLSEPVLIVSPTAKCLNNSYSGSEVMVSWINSNPPVSRVELDMGTPDNPDIRSKDVLPSDTITYAPVGFSGNPELQPDQTYHIRLKYGDKYTQAAAFKIPSSCSR